MVWRVRSLDVTRRPCGPDDPEDAEVMAVEALRRPLYSSLGRPLLEISTVRLFVWRAGSGHSTRNSVAEQGLRNRYIIDGLFAELT